MVFMGDTILVSQEDRYCVYHHICDGEIFYVGSGVPERPFARTDRGRKWMSYVSEHPEYTVEIVARFYRVEDARSFEKAQIKELTPRCNSAYLPRGKSVNTSLISMRIPNALLAAIDAQAKAEDRSRSKVIVMRLSGDSSNARIQSREDRRIKRTAAAEPLMRVRSQSDEGDSQPRPKPFRASRPAHAPNCSCGMCRPSK